MAGLRLKAELGGDGSGFDAMMRRANASKDKFGAAFSGLKGIIAGAFTVGAITNFSRATIDLASDLRDVADSLNINVELMQKMANSVALAGGKLEDLQKFAFDINKSRQEAVDDPKGKAAGAFGRLGMTSSDISSLPIQDFILKLQRAFANGATASEANDLQEVGGRAAKKLIAGFIEGFDTGRPIISEDVVNQLDEIGDRFTILGTRLKTEFAPVLVDVADTVIKVFRGLKVFVLETFGFWSALISSGGNLDAAREQARKNRNFLINQFSEDDLRAAATSQNRQAIRNRSESESPALTSNKEPKGEKEKKVKTPGEKLVTDSLVGVGNFLGRNPALVNSVANQQLQVARNQLDVLKQMLVAFQAQRNRPQDKSVQFPPS